MVAELKQGAHWPHSNSTATGSSYFSNSRSPSLDDLRTQRSFTNSHRSTLSQTRALPTPLPGTPSKNDRYEYAYSLLAGQASIQFIISVGPATSGTPSPGKYTITLSLKSNTATRQLGEPIQFKLTDPRRLNFIVFLIPGKTSLPVNSLYSYRVWLRSQDIDHRLFGEDDLWLGRDPDFLSIADASFAIPKRAQTACQVYEGVVGRALVQFIIRWMRVAEDTYDYSMEYEAGGVGATLFEDLRLKVEGDPRTVTFHIYTVPVKSIPVNASHHVRVWMKTCCGTDSYVYQRVWKSDGLKLGARLDFASLGNKIVIGRSLGMPTAVAATSQASRKHFGSYSQRTLDRPEHVEIG
ncbi:hypothetical protein CYLTODRAFT_187395 [Cylindrobasidium torrendii FP15055 ss-10]|uniref:Uncharacterized protein n=1 Tax=Cylindrobasidium torrendii FP15055 ss-10 TaxID=1314674 RepID=A0A0D7BIV8_9AGAR|nr:hypothetical protein CYLTODRAFT_187395 [Cylindrobasidium torrendii FP15055 ss-10]